jgi:hypothetical protein
MDRFEKRLSYLEPSGEAMRREKTKYELRKLAPRKVCTSKMRRGR